jgi:hypothetical protein
MRNDPLGRLLMRADAEAAAPPRIGDVVAIALLRARRRRRIRTTGGVAIVLLAVGLFVFRNVPGGRLWPPQHGIAEQGQWVTQAEILNLDGDAAIHLKTARTLERLELAAARRRQAVQKRAEMDPVERVNELQEQAGIILLRTADARLSGPGQQQEGQVICRELLRFFPDTAAARQARQRLRDSGT